MIIRNLSTQRPTRGADDARRPERRIHMWERIQRMGRTFYVPLDQSFRPLGDLALEDPGNNVGWLLSQTVPLVPTAERRPEPDEIERLVVRFVRKLLEDCDATTYEICEALMLNLERSRLLDAGASVDMLSILGRNFRHYEFETEHGAVLRKWTLRDLSEDEQRNLAREALENWELFLEGLSN